jgi:septum formation inhibitor-activating ATPase MinD
MDKKFTYVVKIVESSPILADGALDMMFPRAGEMVITSKQFDKYVDCHEKMLGLLSMLTTASSTVSKKNHVIVSRINPDMDETKETKPVEGEMWDDFTLMKSYVANAEALKNSELRYTIISAITVNSGIASLAKSDLVQITE